MSLEMMMMIIKGVGARWIGDFSGVTVPSELQGTDNTQGERHTQTDRQVIIMPYSLLPMMKLPGLMEIPDHHGLSVRVMSLKALLHRH